MHKKNIVVAFGGNSPEHEVSVITSLQAIHALKETSYSIIPLYISKEGRWFTGEYLLELEHFKNLNQIKQKAISCVFTHNENGIPILQETTKRSLFSSPQQHRISTVLVGFHGADGENGAFQGICDFYNIPYTGCGVMASVLGMDKALTKERCRLHHIPVTPGTHFSEVQWVDDQSQIVKEIEELSYPVIVKPVHLGSSIGVQRAENREELTDAVETAFRFDEQLLAEKAIQPLTEINCSVLGYASELEASVCERPKGKTEMLSFEDKYQSDDDNGKGMASSDRVIPADIPDAMAEKIQKLSMQIFELFDAAGVARLDFLVNQETDELYFNEINTIPGSFSFYLWEKSGYTFKQLLLKMIDIAHKTHQRRNRRIRSYDTNLLSQKAAKGLKGLKGNKS